MVGDLGLGKSMEVSSRLTVIAGTPSFVAPEQAQGEPLDPRADLYSLAALTFLLLSGRAAYAHASLSAAAQPGPPPPLSTPERPLDAAVEEVVHRGLAADREERWPDVASYLAALGDALGPVGAEAPEPWLPLDPQLTQPGAPPSRAVDDGPLPDQLAHPVLPRRRGRRLALAGLSCLVVLGAAAVVGYVVAGDPPESETVDDATGSLTVTVPAAWHEAVAVDGWRPEKQADDYPAVSVGTSADWDERSGAEGVFVGILPGVELPERVPGHPECERAQEPVLRDDALTVFHTGCPGDGVIVERVVQLTDNRLLWVQVRTDTSGTANRVLDDVETHGFD